MNTSGTLPNSHMVRIKDGAQVHDCTWSEFRTANADGFTAEQLDQIGCNLYNTCEADVSEFMHCGSPCMLYTLIKSETGCGCEVEGARIIHAPGCAAHAPRSITEAMDAERATFAARGYQINTD